MNVHESLVNSSDGTADKSRTATIVLSEVLTPRDLQGPVLTIVKSQHHRLDYFNHLLLYQKSLNLHQNAL